MCPIIVFSVLYNIPKFFEVRTRCSVTVTQTDIVNISAWVRSVDLIQYLAKQMLHQHWDGGSVCQFQMIVYNAVYKLWGQANC